LAAAKNTQSQWDNLREAFEARSNERIRRYDETRRGVEHGEVEEERIIPKKIENFPEIDLNKQSEELRELIEKFTRYFEYDFEMDGKKFLCSRWSIEDREENSGMACLVSNNEEPERWRLRAFRVSGSDRQIKAIPGQRGDGNYMKGDEYDFENHNYTTSDKLVPEFYEVIQQIPTEEEEKKSEFFRYCLGLLPVGSDESWADKDRKNEPYTDKDVTDKKYYERDFTFSEEQVRFKNAEWDRLREEAKKERRLYERLNGLVDYANLFGGNYRNEIAVRTFEWLKRISDSYCTEEDRSELAKEIEKIWTKVPPDGLKRISMQKWPSSSKERFPELEGAELMAVMERIKFMRDEEIPKILERMMEGRQLFGGMESAGMIPDFSKEPMRKYRKWRGGREAEEGEGVHIDIEEYEVRSPEGDVMRWAMATDEKGRVYIDNTYDPTVGMDDYGCFNKKLNMGMLAYKPEDYGRQALGIPEKYISSGSTEKYVDISRFWALRPPIAKYIYAKKYRNARGETKI